MLQFELALNQINNEQNMKKNYNTADKCSIYTCISHILAMVTLQTNVAQICSFFLA